MLLRGYAVKRKAYHQLYIVAWRSLIRPWTMIRCLFLDVIGVRVYFYESRLLHGSFRPASTSDILTGTLGMHVSKPTIQELKMG